MYNEVTIYFAQNWALKALFISVFLVGHLVLICYLHKSLGFLADGVSVINLDKMQELLIPVLVALWFLCYYSSLLVNRDIGVDLNTDPIDLGILHSLFNLVVTIVAGLFDAVFFLIGIPVSFIVIFIGIPAVIIYLVVTLPLLVYGLYVTAHYYLIRHPGEEYLDKERPDITGFKQAMRNQNTEKAPAYVTENYRRRAKNATDSIKEAKEKERQAIAEHEAAVEREKIQAEIAILQEKERKLTEKYGTKDQRESKQALNEQEAELMQKFTFKNKHD